MAKTPTWSYRGTSIALVIALALVQAGCGEDESPPGGSSRSPNTPGASTPQGVNVRTPIGADQDDDARHPKALPHTGDVPGWVKTRAIRVASADKAGDLTPDAGVLAAIRAFRVASVASCRYNQQITSAEVLFIQAATPADAFGLLSVLVPNDPQTIAADRSIRAVHMGNAAMRMAAQQGVVCVMMNVAGRVDLESNQQSCRRLMDSMIFSLPAADPPLMMQAIVDPRRSSMKVWLVRDTAALAKVEHPLVRRIATDLVARTLGLPADVVLSIAAVPATDTAAAHLIWLAEYPTPDAVKAAYDRCRAASQPAASSPDLHLTVLDPKGNRLAGAWIEQAATMVPLLKNLQDALPR